jgi:hypothetical protein
VQRAVNMRIGYGEVITFSRVCFGVLFKFCPIRNFGRELGSGCEMSGVLFSVFVVSIGRLRLLK